MVSTRTSDRSRSRLRPCSSSSSRSRAASSSLLSPAALLFLSTNLMLCSTLRRTQSRASFRTSSRNTLPTPAPEKPRATLRSSAIGSRRSFYSLLDLSLYCVLSRVSSWATRIHHHQPPFPTFSRVFASDLLLSLEPPSSSCSSLFFSFSFSRLLSHATASFSHSLFASREFALVTLLSRASYRIAATRNVPQFLLSRSWVEVVSPTFAFFPTSVPPVLPVHDLDVSM